jgi:hypothetical protein
VSSRTTASPKSLARSDSRRRQESGGTLFHLRRALALLRREAPRRYAAIAAHLRRAPGRYLVGAERFTVLAAEGSITAAAGWRTLGAKLEAEIPPQAILDLYDGITTTELLVAHDVLRIRAAPAALLAIDDASRILAAAAVESRALQNEFHRYRTWVLSSTREDGNGAPIR